MRATGVRGIMVLALAAGTAAGLAGQPRTRGADKAAGPDLSEFRTVAKAITTRISRESPSTSPAQVGYLGVQLAPDDKGKLAVADVEADSPAAKAGLRRGDVVVRVGGEEVANPEAFRERLHALPPGTEVKLGVVRQGKPREIRATLSATSRPLKLSAQRALIGIMIGEPEGVEGVPVAEVTPGAPAAKAGVKPGDVIRKIDGVTLSGPEKLREFLLGKKPGDTVKLTLARGEKPVDVEVELIGEPNPEARRFARERDEGYWKKDRYRLAVVCVEYPDVKHNDKAAVKDWQEAFFSKGTYTRKSATGQPVFGSLNDYSREQSSGRLRVEGKVFDWVEVSKKRADYAEGGGFRNRAGLLTEALDKLLEREGKDALEGFDGIGFLYAGGTPRGNRAGLYWPHRASVMYQGKRWAYFIVPEGGPRMADISVACHEFGHMLGLPDLYGRGGDPGSVGVGSWCAMSIEAGNGRPQHFSAWCKEQLGWLEPAVIDPTVQQKLVLSPVEDSPKECVKVLIQRDGSEYLLLENRRKKGFDQSVPAEGLLIWHVVHNRPILEESHGISGPAGPNVFASAVPYPSPANNAFTPYTVPSSRSQLAGGLPVHLTNIRRLPDGRVTFYVGYEYE